jgi:hypothetical protein
MVGAEGGRKISLIRRSHLTAPTASIVKTSSSFYAS